MTPASESGRADLIFTGGRVHTLDARNSVAEALAVAGDRILRAGSDTEIRALAGPGTRRVELRGRSLLPGFIDAHCHFTWLGSAQSEIDCKAPGMDSIAALVEAVRQRAGTLPRGAWIRGRGYDQTKLTERRHPNRFDFDPVSPEHPVIFTRTCGHILAANSRALALAGVDDATPDPPAGRFDRENGRNLGVVYEEAQAPFQRASALTQDELRAALLAANHAYLSAGTTSVHDAGGLAGPALGLAQGLIAEDALKVRLYAFPIMGFGNVPATLYIEAGLRTGFGDARLRIGAFKVVTDGSSSGPTAATRAPYTSNPADSGILYWSQDELDDLIDRAHRANFQVTMHTLGDRAIEQGLNAIERALGATPRPDPRPRLEHCGICPPDLQQRVRALGVTPAMQPAFFWEFGDGYLANYGRERADTIFPVRSLVGMGVRVAGSSDAPVTDYRPLFGIQQALTRATLDGEVCGPDERVDLDTALRLYTINAAYAEFAEQEKGSLEPGKLADCVVLGDDLARVPADKIRDTPVALTVSGGRVVYEDGGPG
jgi:predicted amidohydrolase YtcJ